MYFLNEGGYLLTQKDVFFDRARACQLISAIMAQNDQNIRIQLPPPAIMKVLNWPFNAFDFIFA